MKAETMCPAVVNNLRKQGQEINDVFKQNIFTNFTLDLKFEIELMKA